MLLLFLKVEQNLLVMSNTIIPAETLPLLSGIISLHSSCYTVSFLITLVNGILLS